MNVPCMKNAKEQGIPVRKVTGKMLWQSEAGENVLRLSYITHSEHKYVMVFKIIEVFTLTLLRDCLTQWFFGVFLKSILREFHYTLFNKKLAILQDICVLKNIL
jgi:hypothetical protein